LENRLYVHDIDHLMDNFTLRPVPGHGDGVAIIQPRLWLARRCHAAARRNKLRAGIDLHRNEFEAEQVARHRMLRGRDTFHDNRRSRIGAYVDWEQKHSAKWSSRFGVRGDVVMSDADEVSNAIMNPGATRTDMNAFNAADRSFTDVLPAATAALRFEPDENTGIELAAALKSRAPSLVERYLWTPLNASAGLADGRTYLGNLDLDPETSFQSRSALTRKGEQWNAGSRPSIRASRITSRACRSTARTCGHAGAAI
jgi:iron complex outermembrane recepter protein